MLIELHKDPLFVVSQSPITAIKHKEIARKKQIRDQRVNPIQKKKEVDIEVVNPFPQEMEDYRAEISFKTSVETSKASESLKKYVIEQERNLRCLRLDRITFDDRVSNSRMKSLALNMTEIQDQDRSGKQIHIPIIEELFKNQSKEILIHENAALRQRLGKMMLSLDQGINRFKTVAQVYSKEVPSANNPSRVNNSFSEEDYEMDSIFEKKLLKSKDLVQKLYNERKEMKAPGESKSKSKANNMSYFLREVEKPKRKVELKGVRTCSYYDGERSLKLTPASILLFEMNRLSNHKEKKEYELNGLLKNSYQNRDSILKQKQLFYESQNQFSDLSPSKQFQLRKVMNKKLNHRLEISKQQVNKFTNYLYEIKNYHVILNESILQILKEVRETLLRGKVMKISDFQLILGNKNSEDLKKEPNELIIGTLTEMMI